MQLEVSVLHGRILVVEQESRVYSVSQEQANAGSDSQNQSYHLPVGDGRCCCVDFEEGGTDR